MDTSGSKRTPWPLVSGGFNAALREARARPVASPPLPAQRRLHGKCGSRAARAGCDAVTRRRGAGTFWGRANAALCGRPGDSELGLASRHSDSAARLEWLLVTRGAARCRPRVVIKGSEVGCRRSWRTSPHPSHACRHQGIGVRFQSGSESRPWARFPSGGTRRVAPCADLCASGGNFNAGRS